MNLARICWQCGKSLPANRRRNFCTDLCASRYARARHVEAANRSPLRSDSSRKLVATLAKKRGAA